MFLILENIAQLTKMVRFLSSLAAAALVVGSVASAFAVPDDAATHSHRVTVGLPIKPKAMADLERLFWDVSTPGSGRYLRHASLDELKELLVSPTHLQSHARKWLREQGA